MRQGMYLRERSREKLIFTPALQHLQVYTEAVTGLSPEFIQLVSTTRYCLNSRSLRQLRLQGWWVKHTFQGQGRGEEPLIAQVRLAGQPVVTFPR